MGRPQLSELVTVSSLAKSRGLSYDKTRRWLNKLDEKHGGRVVFRMQDKAKGVRIYTTLAMLRAVEPGLVEEQITTRDEIECLKRKNADLEMEIRRMKSRMREILLALQAGVEFGNSKQ